MKVSVLFPVYNAAPFLKRAVLSLKAQTFGDFEVLAFDDCSTDGSWELLNRIADERFRLFRNERNSGYVVGLNRGLQMASGDYVARMDADDQAHATRFEEQVAVLEREPRVGIVGSGCTIMDGAGKVTGKILKPKTDEEIRWMALLDNPFLHPTVMMRRKILIERQLTYREAMIPTEDYALWSELLQYSQGYNLGESLLNYRWHSSQISQEKRARQLEVHDEVSLEMIRRVLPGVEISKQEVTLLRRWVQGEAWNYIETRAGRTRLIEKWMELCDAFSRNISPQARERVREHAREQMRRGFRQEGINSLSWSGAWKALRFVLGKS